MANLNLKTLSVETLNFTGPNIYHRGRPIQSFPTDASGAGHGGSLCLDRLGVGSTAPCPNPHYILDVSGTTRIIGSIADASGVGQPGQVITATSDGWLWTDVSGTAGANLWTQGGGSYIYYETGDVGIGTNSPSAKLDVSGNVLIHGTLDLSCNRIIDVSGIYFCDASGSSITGGNSLDISSNIVYFKNKGGDIPITVDISGNTRLRGGIYFCDASGSSITGGNSLDISSNIVYFKNKGGQIPITVDISGNTRLRGGIYFCDASGSSITGGNSLDISSNIVYFKNKGGQIPITVDISGNTRLRGGIYFCDASGSSITGGNSLDISSNIVYFKNKGGDIPITVDISGNTRLRGALYDTVGVSGISGQVLSSTGTGTDWVNAAGGGSGGLWSSDTSGTIYCDISGDSTKVGIGTKIPKAMLDVSGDALINGLTVGLGTGNNSTNTVVGYEALMSNTSGGDNVAIGYQALYTNDSSFNVATGAQALFTNTTGDNNVATGAQALYYNTSGSFNVATGANALSNNTDGSGNVAVGAQALFQNNIGINNTAIGFKAGIGQTNISNTICVGNDTSCNANNTVCIGNADISCVYLGSTSGNAKLDCSGTVIGRQGITLDGSSHIPAGPGNFGIINFDGNCGKIDMSGSLAGGAYAYMTMNNSTIKASSLVFASIIPANYFDSLVKSCNIIDGGCQFYIDNPVLPTFTTPSGPVPERIQFMVINPST